MNNKPDVNIGLILAERVKKKKEQADRSPFFKIEEEPDKVKTDGYFKGVK